MSIVIIGEDKPKAVELKNLLRWDTFIYKGDIYLVCEVYPTTVTVDCLRLGELKSGGYVPLLGNTKVNEITVKISFEYI